MVLAAGVLLVVALGAFLVRGKWKNPLNLSELPKKLGVNIQQDASGYTFEHSFGSHSRYKIHASKVVQYRQGTAVLHQVKIELYDEDGGRVDRIEGDEFEYDQKGGTASAAGPVEITLMRPSVAPAITLKSTPTQLLNQLPKGSTLAAAAQAASASEIHVKTSGLTFNQKTGIATTSQPVEFAMAQGTGSSVGATYDSQRGQLVLNEAVEVTTERAGERVQIHAQHAEFQRENLLCLLRTATANYRGGEAKAGDAKVLFRADGSAVRLDANNGFTMATATGAHLAAPSGSIEFNERNQPRQGHLEGGIQMDSISQPGGRYGTSSRHVHATSPTAQFDFNTQGNLRHIHLERNVEMHSEEQSEQSSGPVRLSRTWRSPLADVEFRDAGNGQVEPATIHGAQGVVITGESQRGKEAAVPSRMAADEVTGQFASGSVLEAMTGVGHASLEETNAAGTRQSTRGDRIEAHFAVRGSDQPKSSSTNGNGGPAQIQSATLDGHVELLEVPATKPGAPAPTTLRATGGHAAYEGEGEWLHLTVNPRVDDGGLQLTAEKIDVSRASGDAFAHGNVKATWLNQSSDKSGLGSNQAGAIGQQAKPSAGSNAAGSIALGGQGPAHAIGSDAQLHQATGEATFRGHARLWQDANSVAGPEIVLNRQKQTLVARSNDPAEPVRVVLLSAAKAEHGTPRSLGIGKTAANVSDGKSSGGSVIRVSGGDLRYSDAEHKAVMHGGVAGTVHAETGTATSISNEVEMILLPPGNHAGKDGSQGQVDRMTASGHVTVNSEGRIGTGERLVYSSETGEYVLTGTAAVPPRMIDPGRGTVTGGALIFNSRDDSVSSEGDGRKTTTDTTAPR